LSRIEKISVVVPMRDEAAHIEGLVRDLAAQDFAGEVEVFVADGRSSDDSVALLQRAAADTGVPVEVIDNPVGTVAPGLNACIRRATGDLIVRMDCHSSYPPDYLRRNAEAIEETGAWCVGGIFLPIGRTRVERAVAAATDSSFGGIGWTRHGETGEPVEIDAVPYGAFIPHAFRAAGLFDESLVRNQDDELTLRIRLAGGKVFFDPRIRIRYTPRGSYSSLFHQYREYGFWRTIVTARYRRLFGARSLVPVAFVTSLAGLAVLSPFQSQARWLLGAEVAAYASAAAAFGVAAVRRREEPWTLLPGILAAYPTFHVGYGVGMLQGALRVLLNGSGRPMPPPTPTEPAKPPSTA
jgi:glycosyltransferase involved in cell wall biosynthesis